MNPQPYIRLWTASVDILTTPKGIKNSLLHAPCYYSSSLSHQATTIRDLKVVHEGESSKVGLEDLDSARVGGEDVATTIHNHSSHKHELVVSFSF